MKVTSRDVSEIRKNIEAIEHEEHLLIKAQTKVLSSEEADHLPSKTSQMWDWKDEEDEEPEKVKKSKLNKIENVSKDLPSGWSAWLWRGGRIVVQSGPECCLSRCVQGGQCGVHKLDSFF